MRHIYTILFLFINFLAIVNAQTQLGSTICGDHVDGRFGETVAVSENGLTIAVASTGFMNDMGMVRVFEYDGQEFLQKGQELFGTGAGELYGVHLDLSHDGSILALTAPYYGTTMAPDRGKVDVFKFNSVSNRWEQSGTSIVGPSGTRLGIGLSLSSEGSQMLTGQSMWPPPSSYQFYDYTNNNWEKGNHIDVSLSSLSAQMQISDDGQNLVLAIKGPNSTDGVEVYNLVGGQWVKKGQSILVPFESGSTTSSVSINGNGSVVAFSDVYARNNGNFSGTTFIYAFENGSWDKLGDQINGNTADYLGNHVDLNNQGNRIAIHLSPNDVNGKQVNIYDFINNNWLLKATITGSGAFGRGMDLNASGDIIAIGSPWIDCNGNDAGDFKVFDLSELSDVSKPLASDFYVYPNPVFDNVYIEGDGKVRSIYIHDIHGKCIYFDATSISSSIDCSDWQTGMYLMKLELEQEVRSFKLFKQ